MKRKILAISVILAALSFSVYYYKTQLKYYKYVADGGVSYQGDIISMNKDHFDPMADQLMFEVYGQARRSLLSDFQIIEMPIEEKVGRAINWFPEDNLKPTLFLYTRDGIYVDSQANVLLAGYVATPNFKKPSYEEYLANEEVEAHLLEYDYVYQSYLMHLLIYQQGESLQTVFQRGREETFRAVGNTQVPLKSFLRFVSVALVHASVHCLIARKIGLLRKVLAVVTWESVVPRLDYYDYRRIATEHVEFNKDSSLWINAYRKQHRIRNHSNYKDSYHYWLAIVLAVMVPIPFSFVQLIRTDTKRLIYLEMVKLTLDVERYDLDRIAKLLPGSIIWRPSDRVMRVKIREFLHPLVQEARTRALQFKKERRQHSRRKADEELNQKADQLLDQILEYDFDDDNFSTVDQYYSRATDSNELIKRRKKAVAVLQRELGRLDSIQNKRDSRKEMQFLREFKKLLREERVSGSFPKVSRPKPESDEELQKAEETDLVDSDNLIADPLATDQFLRDESARKSRRKKSDLLSGKRVLVSTGTRAHGSVQKYLDWVEELGADSVKYVPSFKKSHLSSAMAHADLAIVLLPADHSVTHTAKRHGVECVYLKVRSERRFKNTIRERLT